MPSVRRATDSGAAEVRVSPSRVSGAARARRTTAASAVEVLRSIAGSLQICELRRMVRHEPNLHEVAEVVEVSVVPEVGKVEDARRVVSNFESLGRTPLYG